jgi:hypothetical protein
VSHHSQEGTHEEADRSGSIRGERAPAIKAVFRELAWQRSHLRALQSNA